MGWSSAVPQRGGHADQLVPLLTDEVEVDGLVKQGPKTSGIPSKLCMKD